jgi:N-acetylmuramoyl-L-alanine amidase
VYHIPLPKRSSVLPATRYQKPKSKPKKRVKKTYASRSHKYELIVIDAGHGGHDTGAIGAGKREKDLVLQISKRLKKQLKKRGHPVYMTRKKDRFLKLPQRTRIADKKKAVVFISIHANSVPRKKRNKIQGVETFFLQKTRDARSQRIAAREHKSVLKGTNKLSRSVIIDSVLSGPKIVQSNKLAIDVQRRIMANLRSRYKGVKDGGVRHAPFWVLVGASRPSILVEVGYISHPKERKRLFTPRYQELIAKGIAEGVDNYLNNRKKEIDF